jgi:transcriptional regulator with XRE-family HTH domain
MTDEPNLKEIWRAEEKKKKREEKIAKETTIQEVYDSAPKEEVEIKSDWERLKTLAQLKFPPHLAEKFQLRPQQRLSAIAFSIGWTLEKISVASGIHRNTISRWLNHDETVREFVKAFEYHNGTKDSKEVVDNEQYTSLQVLKDLRDDPSTSASTRKEIAIWFYEQKHGKAKESKEVKGINIRDLTEQLKSNKAESILEEFESTVPAEKND